MGQPYTMGTWVTQPEKEDAFVAAWREFADWTSREVGGATSALLLRDVAEPRRFVSIGPWESLEASRSASAKRGSSRSRLRRRECHLASIST